MKRTLIDFKPASYSHGGCKIQAEIHWRIFQLSGQQAGLVPIIEPDVEFSRDADLGRSVELHERVISLIYEKMKAYGVLGGKRQVKRRSCLHCD